METEQEHPLIVARNSRNMTQQELAKRVKLSPKTIWAAENNLPISAHSRQLLCKYFRTNAQTLGLVSVTRKTPARNKRRSDTAPLAEQVTQLSVQIQSDGLSANIQSTQGTVAPKQETENRDMDELRRRLLQGAVGMTGIALVTIPHGVMQYITDIPEASLVHLAAMNQHYRAMQRQGIPFLEKGLQAHIATIQQALEKTINDKKRCELWRILAQTQLLARLNVRSKQELSRGRTLNDLAITSAQNSGDTVLVGASLGHLAHWYLREMHDTKTAYQLIHEAKGYAQVDVALNGWLTIIEAFIASEEGNKTLCEYAIAQAMDIAYQIPQMPEYTDPYYTDFSIVGVEAFVGHCLLNIGKSIQAYELLTKLKREELSENRQSSVLYDISRACLARGEVEAAQMYALQSIDKAVATNHLYIVPRFINLAQSLQQQCPHESHATAIIEYVHTALQTS